MTATAAAGSAGGVAVSLSSLAALPGWLLVAMVVAVVLPAAVLVGMLLMADGPVGRFERIVAALRRTAATPTARNTTDMTR
jgi:hypothetical protein